MKEFTPEYILVGIIIAGIVGYVACFAWMVAVIVGVRF